MIKNMKENDMTTIYLIRHAEAEGNRYRRAHGWYNSTITDRPKLHNDALHNPEPDTIEPEQ